MKRLLKIHAIVAALACGAAGMLQAQNTVSFSVDMSKLVAANSFTNGVNSVAVAGSFNGWANSPSPAGSVLTNDPTSSAPTPGGGYGSNVYSGTIPITDSVGTVEYYKFIYYNPNVNWESPDSTCGNNRSFTLAGGTQVLPGVSWNDEPVVLPTNNCTFSVDMTAQIQITGAFTPGSDHVYCPGGFNGWSTTVFQLTNNPNLQGNASNIYSGTWPLAAVGGSCQAYKFYIDRNSNWESPASTGGNNRTFNAAGAAQALPTVFFNDDGLGDFLPADTEVTFNVSMTNAIGTDGTVFIQGTDTPYLNGDFLGWWTWGLTPPANYAMTNNPPGSEIYSLTVIRPKGTTLPLTYKYSIDGPDNENGFQINHFRYIRQTTNYNMPLDLFGTNHPTGPITEPYPGFGSLAANGDPTVSWLGRPGVHLQVKSNLGPGTWTDLPLTDGTNWTTGYLSNYGFVSTTNVTASGTSMFFRLVKP